ncbi:MAG TPA: sulfate adenylyltransferase [Thermoplasmatales archaeon]|nr:sulfate adenylyltransferase [Candidatus Thermoplasmatota archaeon]HDS59112.1 sulfate adenylyltransferase [Thermoplasmatales archaeon]
MQRPHGGKLISRHAAKEPAGVEELPAIEVATTAAEDIINIANGVLSPLTGFLGHDDLDCVIHHKRLGNDVPWTIPILFDLDTPDVREGDTILLTNQETGLRALLEVEELFDYDRTTLAKEIYATTDAQHPGVSAINSMRRHFAGGDILLVGHDRRQFDEYHLTPQETRVLFREKGWKEIVAFQTRNPPHLGHEYVQKTALTFADGIFINPLIGKKKPGDFRDEVILRSYEALMQHYYLQERSVMAILRTAMRYAGPREAVHHAIMRKNFGCTHFIVGRDHAGVGNYYGPYDAHDIFDEFPDLGITPVFFRSFSRCTKCDAIVNDKICPHGPEHHINFSGKKIRELLQQGKIPPEDMMRKEVAETILQFDHPFVE